MMKRLLLFTMALLAFACSKDDEFEDSFWETKTPGELRVDPNYVNAALDAGQTSGNFYGILVVRDGYIIGERYYRGKNAESLLHLRSITKPVSSAAYFLAQEEGTMPGKDTKLKAFYSNLAGEDQGEVSLYHLMNMTGGFLWTEETEVIDMIDYTIPNPLEEILGRPLASEPGVSFNYNSALPHVLADVIAKESGMPYEEYVAGALFAPLGIERYDWTRDPQGNVWGGFGLQLALRDLGRIGLLFMNDGQWQSDQLIPARWMDEVNTKQFPIGSTAIEGYSYYWWQSQVYGRPLLYARGYGGQGLFIVPSLNLMVIGMQEHYVTGSQDKAQWRALVNNVLAPIVEGSRN